MSAFAVDFSKAYAKRRSDEPRSHYAQRLKFINELRRGESTIDDLRVEVLSNCYSNVKFLNNTYHSEIMEILEKYDPDVKSTSVTGSIAHVRVPSFTDRSLYYISFTMSSGLMLQRLDALRLKMNQGRLANNAAVIEEQKRILGIANQSKKQPKHEEGNESDDEDERDKKRLRSVQVCNINRNTSRRDDGGNDDGDRLYRAHNKRTLRIKVSLDQYNQRGVMNKEESTKHLPSERAKNSLVQELLRNKEDRLNFSRRRKYNPDAQVTHINDFNKKFNKKLENLFSKHTETIKESLERGSAI